MSLNNGISVRKNPLWDLPLPATFLLWQFDCRYCDDRLEFADHATALEWANRHAAKHAALTCGTCGSTPYIREDFQ